MNIGAPPQDTEAISGPEATKVKRFAEGTPVTSLR